MKKILLLLKLTCLTAVVSSCGFDISGITPHVLDTKRDYARVYEIKKITPESCGAPDYKVSVTLERKPISDMDGYWCIPKEQGQDILKHYDEYLYRKANCPQEIKPRDFKY